MLRALRQWAGALTAVVALAGIPAAAADLVPENGARTPALALADLSGARHDLAQYKGKVVLLNFWATWCEPCRAEMPSMDQLRERYPDGSFVVLAVNVDEPEQRVRAFLQRVPLSFQVLLDPGMRATREWNARILPTSYLIGRDGRIRYSARGEVEWTSGKVAGAVAELVKASER